jgi:hypothetical protein
MMDAKICIILIIIIVIGLWFHMRLKENEHFYVEAPFTLDYPMYPEFDKYGRHILPKKYLDYGPYWQPPDRPSQFIGTESRQDLTDDDAMDVRPFW